MHRQAAKAFGYGTAATTRGGSARPPGTSFRSTGTCPAPPPALTGPPWRWAAKDAAGQWLQGSCLSGNNPGHQGFCLGRNLLNLFVLYVHNLCRFLALGIDADAKLGDAGMTRHN